MGAGPFRDVFVRMEQTTTKDSIGQNVESFYEGETLYGQWQDVNSQKQTDIGVYQSITTARIILRNIISMSERDRLLEMSTGITWIILGITYDRLNTYCTVKKPETYPTV